MTSLYARRWAAWGRDAAERALKTVAQTVIAVTAITEGIALDALFEAGVWSIGLAAGVLSLLSSLVSKQTGDPSSAALFDV